LFNQNDEANYLHHVLSVKIEHCEDIHEDSDNGAFEFDHQVQHMSAAVFKNQKIVLLQVK
jgi:hypothetical protein